MYTVEYYLAIKKEIICDNMDESRQYQAKWRKSDREKQILYDLIFMCNLKNKNKQTENRLIDTENKLGGRQKRGEVGNIVKGIKQ